MSTVDNFETDVNVDCDSPKEVIEKLARNNDELRGHLNHLRIENANLRQECQRFRLLALKAAAIGTEFEDS